MSQWINQQRPRSVSNVNVDITTCTLCLSNPVLILPQFAVNLDSGTTLAHVDGRV